MVFIPFPSLGLMMGRRAIGLTGRSRHGKVLPLARRCPYHETSARVRILTAVTDAWAIPAARIWTRPTPVVSLMLGSPFRAASTRDAPPAQQALIAILTT